MRGIELSSLNWLEANRRFAAALVQSLTSPASTLSPRVSGLAVHIPPLRTGIAEAGKRIYRGEFCFAGESVFCRDAPIFDAPAPCKAWLEGLYGFDWLKDLEATGLELARVNARALVSDWLERDRHHPKLARTLPILCRRLMAWIAAAPFLMEHAGEDFLGRFFSGLAGHIRDLQLRSTFSHSLPLRLDCAVAIAYAAVALKGMEGARPVALEQLADKLDQQILPDGGHISRNPAELARLLLDILPLRLACEEARIDMPAKLRGAIERMLPMLRFFLHGDGGLALFHGAANPLVPECAAILGADPTQGRPLSNAPYSCFMRLSHGNALVICDTGLPAAQGSSHFPFAFEFSEASSRIVINCGALLDQESAPDVAALPKVHGTATRLTYPRQAPLPLQLFFAGRRREALKAEASLSSTSAGSLVEARHNAYAQFPGVIHERCLFLSTSGTDLRGEDRFKPVSNVSVGEACFQLSFHLHPDVRAALTENGTCVILELPGKIAWTFKAKGADISLADSVCSWVAHKTKQIILTGPLGPSPIMWAFKRARHPN